MKFAIGLACAAAVVFAQQVELYETLGDQTKKLERRSGALLSDGAPPAGAIVIAVDEAVTFQTIDGFGASLTDSSASLIAKLDKVSRESLLTALFSVTRGAGISLLRQPMGASDFSSRGNYSYQDSEGGAFSIAPDLEATIPLLKAAVAINPGLKVMALPWSAPAWMKTNGSMNGGGLRRDQYAAFARYFVQFLAAYQVEGVPVYAVSMQNEPLFQTPGYPSTLVSAADEAVFLGQYLGPALESSTTKIIAYDHNWDHPEYPDAVLSDATAARYVAGTAFHCYAGDVSAQSGLHAKHPDKDIWFTECSGTAGSSFAGDLVWNAKNLLIGATRNWARGVTLWNLALDQNSGPKNGGCEKCRGVVTVDTSATPANIVKNVEYYVLAHAARFVRPNAVRIDSSASRGGISNVAFRNPDGSIAMIVLNENKASSEVSVRKNGRSISFRMAPESLVSLVWREALSR